MLASKHSIAFPLCMFIINHIHVKMRYNVVDFLSKKKKNYLFHIRQVVLTINSGNKANMFLFPHIDKCSYHTPIEQTLTLSVVVEFAQRNELHICKKI